MKDNISDMITRLRNGQKAKLLYVDLFWPTPKNCLKILDILKKEGFIKEYIYISKILNKKIVRVFLKYSKNQTPLITKINRISTSGKRIYIRAQNL